MTTSYRPVSEMLDQPPREVDPGDLAALPTALAARPWHPRLHVPVPVMNVHTDDTHPYPFVDFLGVDPQVSARCLRERLCGICDTEIGDELALLGTIESLTLGVFADPHMHEDCARQALRWCPHLRLRHHKRAAQHRRHPETPDIAEFDTNSRPDRWVLAITGSVTLVLVDGLLLYQPVDFQRLTVFAYLGDNDALTETVALHRGQHTPATRVGTAPTTRRIAPPAPHDAPCERLDRLNNGEGRVWTSSDGSSPTTTAS